MARYLRFFVDWHAARIRFVSLPNCEGRGEEQVCAPRFRGGSPDIDCNFFFLRFFFLIYSEEWRDKWRDILIVSISFESLDLDLDLNNAQAGLLSASF